LRGETTSVDSYVVRVELEGDGPQEVFLPPHA
jgi:hypothetical protein